jgi:hypothetical protein
MRGGAAGSRRDWRPRSRERNRAILDSLGLTGEFWRLS